MENDDDYSLDSDSDYVLSTGSMEESDEDSAYISTESGDGLCYYCSEDLDYVDEYWDIEACRYYCMRCYEDIHEQGFL